MSATIFNKLFTFRRKFKGSRDLLNKQYQAGLWDVLNSTQEKPRFETLVELSSKYCENGVILEIGCGEGLLVPKIDVSYQKFIGLDVSDVAIAKASHLANEKTTFLRADMEKFVTEEKFDIIIFNECLIYSSRPIKLIKRYQKFLKPNGVFASSSFQDVWSQKMLEEIQKEFTVIAHQETKNERGVWHCDIFKT